MQRRLSPQTKLIPAGLVAGLLAGMAACNRTPPEPAPIASGAAESAPRVEPRATTPLPAAAAPGTSAQTTTTSRCIAELPMVGIPTPPPAGPACPADPEPNAKMPMAEVSFPEARSAAKGPPLHIEVELAKTAHDIERGLMYRRAMGDDHGMLFKLDGRRDHTFWMHNTCIPLDMLFVDDDGVIVGIVENAAPLTESTRSVGCPSSFVLEVNGGWSRKRGVAPGQKIALPPAMR